MKVPPSTRPPGSAPGGQLGDLLGLLLTLLALVIAWKLAVPRPAAPVATLPVAACDLQRESCRLTLDDSTGPVDLTKRADRGIRGNERKKGEQGGEKRGGQAHGGLRSGWLHANRVRLRRSQADEELVTVQ